MSIGITPINSFVYTVSNNKIRRLCILSRIAVGVTKFNYICVDVTPDSKMEKVECGFAWEYEKVSKVTADTPRAVKEYREDELFVSPWLAYYHRKKEMKEEVEDICNKMKYEMKVNFDIEKDDEEETTKNE